jgi:hypothetical protein
MSKIETDRLIVSLLINEKFPFDVVKVENSIFNMLTLLQYDGQDQDFNREQKEEIYKSARTPVQLLHENYLKVRNNLSVCMDTDGKEFKKMQKQLLGGLSDI